MIDTGGIESVISGQMAQPTFPVPLAVMGAKMEFEDFRAGDTFKLGDDIVVKTAPLNHPDGATGYRFEHRGKAMCYVTDTEHIPGKPDENILALTEGADLVIYDSPYTDKEFVHHVGWGHSTWQECVRLCQAANVKTLAIFHHDPDHEDIFMELLALALPATRRLGPHDVEWRDRGARAHALQSGLSRLVVEYGRAIRP